MNIYLYELRWLRLQTVIWIGVLGLASLMFISLYPAFSSDMTVTQQLMQNMPPFAREMLGLSLSAFTTFLGFYSFTMIDIMLIGAAQAMGLGLGVMVREQQAKTTDFLLTKPITRTHVFVAKCAAMLTAILITHVAYCVIVYVWVAVFKVGEFDNAKVMVVNASFLALQLWFMMLGIAVSQLVHRVRSVVAYTLGAVFGLFAVGLIGALIGEEKFRYVSPFKYIDYLAYVSEGTIDAQYWLVGSLMALAMLVGGYMLYTHRDKKAVA